MFMALAGVKAGEDSDTGPPPTTVTPTFGSAGATTASITLAGTHNVAYPGGVQLGQLMLCIAVGRNASSDALLAMHANMVANGWQHLTGSPFAPTSPRCLLIAWKYATASDVTASAAAGNVVGGIVGSGGAANNGFLAHCQRWISVDPVTPFESITSVIKTIQTSHIGPTITPTGTNRRGVAIFGGQATSATMSPYGSTPPAATGGTWSAVSHITGTQSCLNTQSTDLSAGGAISGGNTDLSTATGGPLVGFALLPGEGEEEPPPTGPPMFVNWFPSYEARDPPSALPYANYDSQGMFEGDIPWSLGITHLAHFSAWPNSDSSVSIDHWSPGMNPAAVMASRAAAGSTAKILLVMGGAASLNAFLVAVTNNLALLVDNIVATCVTHGYDGVDLDFEPKPETAPNCTTYNTFIRALRVDLLAANPNLTLSISGTSRLGPSDMVNWGPLLKTLADDGVIDWIYVQFIQMAQPSFSDAAGVGYVWHHVALYSNASDFGVPGFKSGVDEALDDYIVTLAIDPQMIVAGTILSGIPWVDGVMDIAPGSGGCFEPLQRWTDAIGANQPIFLTPEIPHRVLRKMVPEPVSVTLTANKRGCGGILTLSNAAANASQPHLIGATSTATSTAPSASSITTTAANTIVFAIFVAAGAQDQATIEAATPAGWTFVTAQRSETATNVNPAFCSIGVVRKNMAAAGASGVATWTGALGASREWLAIQVAFNTAGTGLPTLHGAESFIGHTANNSGAAPPEVPKFIYLHEQSYTAGDYVLGVYSTCGGEQTVSMTSSDDTYALITQVTSATLSLALFEGTVVGAGLGGPNTKRRDVAAGNIPFLSNPLSTFFVNWDDETSLPDKVDFVLGTKGVRGVGVWNVTFDYNSDGTTVAEKHPSINAIKLAIDGL